MSEFISRLEKSGIKPIERLGQHFLIDEQALDFIADQVIPGINVLEVGSGIGNLTERLATRARKVLGIEIDTRFEEVLNKICFNNSNVEIIYQDALKFDYKHLVIPRKMKRNFEDTDWQIIANLPYHITEPFLRIVANFPVNSIVMTLGNNAAGSLLANSPESIMFTKMSLVSLAYFNVEKIGDFKRELFYPIPRTDSSVLRLFPLVNIPNAVSPARRIMRYLLDTEKKMTVEQALQQVMHGDVTQTSKFLGKQDRNRSDRRAMRRQLSAEIDSRSGVSRERKHRNIEISESIRKIQLSNLDNSQIRVLTTSILEHFCIGRYPF